MRSHPGENRCFAGRITTTLLLAGLLGLATAVTRAEVAPFEVRGYTIVQGINLPVTPIQAYDTMTGDISQWWDHTMSDSAFALKLMPVPGGSFSELFDDKGNGAEHAHVIYADRGKRLRFEGPMGLSGRAVNMVTTYDFFDMVDSTRVTVTVNVVGQVDDTLAQLIDQTWHHFLFDQLHPYVLGGMRPPETIDQPDSMTPDTTVAPADMNLHGEGN